MKKLLLLLLVLPISFMLKGQIYLSEGFETSVPPPGWSEYQVTGTNSWARTSTRVHSGSYSAYFDDFSGDHEVWLITSAIDLSTATSPEFTYYENVNYRSYADSNNVWISTNYTGSGDPHQATWISLNDVIGAEDTWEQIGPMDLSAYAGSTVYIAFEYVGNFASEWYIDDVLVEEAPSCLPPTNLISSNITSFSAELNWDNQGSIACNLEYGPKGFTQGTGTVIHDTIPPYTLVGLNPNTEYDWYVQDSCGPGDVSTWTGPETFKTLCSTQSIPYSENFDGVTAPAIPDCWHSYAAATSSYAYVKTSTSYSPHSTPNHVVFYNSSDTSAQLLLASPEFTNLQTDPYQIRFYAYWRSYEAKLIIGSLAVAGDTSSFIPFDTLTLTNSYAEYTVPLTGGQVAGNTIVFKSLPTRTYTYLYIDDFVIEEIPSCPPSSGLQAGSITNSSAELSWTTGGASIWNIEYGPAGFTQGTGTVIHNVTSNPYTLTGLSSNTDYEWYVQDSCGTNDVSSWAGPASFTTLMGPVSNPSACGLALDIPDNGCPSNTLDVPIQVTGAPGTQLGTDVLLKEVRIIIDHTYDGDLDIYLKSPNGVTVELSTDNGSGGNNYGDATNCPNDYTAFNMDAVNSITSGSAPFIGSYIPEGNFSDFNDNSDPNGVWHLIVCDDANGDTGKVQFVELVLEAPPACGKPTDLTVPDTTITVNSAKLLWSPPAGSTPTGYNWEIVPKGDGQGNNVVASGSVTDTFAIVTGLSSATQYDAYVKTDCGSTASDWTGPKSFTTKCPTVVTTFPYEANFDNSGDIQPCWENDPNDAGGEWKFVSSNAHGPSSDHSGSGYYALLDDYLTSSSRSPFNLLTPVFDLSAPNKWYQFSYWVWIGPDGAPEPIHVDISLDGGATWKEDWRVHDHSRTGEWFQVKLNLGNNKSSQVMFRFRGFSIYGYNTCNSAVDDIRLQETQAPPIPLSNWSLYLLIGGILTFLSAGLIKKMF